MVSGKHFRRKRGEYGGRKRVSRSVNEMVKLGLISLPQISAGSLGRLDGGLDGTRLGGDSRLSAPSLRPLTNVRRKLSLHRSEFWCNREELGIRDHSLSRGIVRVLNSAQYRLEKERERGNQKQEDEEDDEDLCPVECVREFRTQAEFDHLLEQAKEEGSLVVVDFFRTACGSCKYIEKGFVKLCKGAGSKDAHVMFLKHNVMDEYEEQSEVADRLRIKVVPLFHFYKDGILVESFPTREKTKILHAICKHTNLDLSLSDFEIP
ncbi:hypothetical protein R1sor_020246 [Riccia sorocarpa]|uniref:Thioredoxin domain-containing protein n=1 Tax=Riccia sorocarpa TaxID=122646 RepID=A0ABD3II54_9MARC